MSSPPREGGSSGRLLLSIIALLLPLITGCSAEAASEFPTGSAATSAGQTQESPITPSVITDKGSQPGCELSGEWSVELHRSGGIAGIDQQLVISNDGELVVEDRDTKAKITGSIPTQDLDALKAALLEACPFPTPPRARPCPDCFVDVIILDPGEGKPQQVQITSDQQLDPALVELFKILIHQLSEALTG